jgi:uncharacterized protein YueI
VSQNCLPKEQREYLGKCDNRILKKKIISQAIIEKKHPKLDQSELKSKFQVNFSLIVAIPIIIFAV